MKGCEEPKFNAETQNIQRDAERNHRWTADGHRFRNANCGNEEMQQMFINAEAAKTRGGAGQETEKRNLTKGNESNGLLSPTSLPKEEREKIRCYRTWRSAAHRLAIALPSKSELKPGGTWPSRAYRKSAAWKIACNADWMRPRTIR